LEDLNSIGEYIARDSERYARLTLSKIRNSVNILKDNPLVGRIVPEVSYPSVREIIHGNYRIIYEIINDNRIDILTVHHSARILKNL